MWPTLNTRPAWGNRVMRVALVFMVVSVSACTGPGQLPLRIPQPCLLKGETPGQRTHVMVGVMEASPWQWRRRGVFERLSPLLGKTLAEAPDTTGTTRRSGLTGGRAALMMSGPSRVPHHPSWMLQACSAAVW